MRQAEKELDWKRTQFAQLEAKRALAEDRLGSTIASVGGPVDADANKTGHLSVSFYMRLFNFFDVSTYIKLIIFHFFINFLVWSNLV